MLTSLIRKPPSKAQDETPEDILDNTSLTIFYPDAQRTFHGDPGSSIIYASKRYGDIKLQLADPEGRDDRWLFAHHLWNSSVLLAELISDEAARAEREASDQRVETGNGEVISRNGGHQNGYEKVGNQGKNTNDYDDDGLRAPRRWSVKGERVLELGAGA